MIQVTGPALKEINKSLDAYQNEIENQYVRLSMSVGWGGPQLKLALEESAGAHDQVIEIEGVKFLINSNAIPYFQNIKIDFVQNLFGVGQFKIITV